MDENTTVQPSSPTIEATQPVVPSTPVGDTAPAVQPTATQPSQDDVIAKKIDEAVAKVRAELESSQRQIQSAKDRAIAELERERRTRMVSESTLNTLRSRVKETDPDFEKDLRLAEYEAREKANQQALVAEQARHQQTQLLTDFYNTLSEHVKEVGLDPSDKRLDYGNEGDTLFQRQQKFLKSLAKAQNETLTQARKEYEAKLRKDAGIDSVDTAAPTGVTVMGIPTDRKAFEKWLGGLTEDEYRKLEPKINQMIDSGQIK